MIMSTGYQEWEKVFSFKNSLMIFCCYYVIIIQFLPILGSSYLFILERINLTCQLHRNGLNLSESFIIFMCVTKSDWMLFLNKSKRPRSFIACCVVRALSSFFGKCEKAMSQRDNKRAKDMASRRQKIPIMNVYVLITQVLYDGLWSAT